MGGALIMDEQMEVTPEEFAQRFGEGLRHTLDVNTWQTGEDLGSIYQRIDEEIRCAVRSEEESHRVLRETVFPRLGDYPGAPRGAGVYAVNPSDLGRIHRGVLFNGGVEAADGTLVSHDSLPLTIFQVGVSLVSYQGQQGVWSHRLFRRDLRVDSKDPTDALMELLERRERREGLNQLGRRDALVRLARRGILAYAERAILLRRSTAAWRLGHGSPAPFELLTGSGSLDLMIESTRVIREMVEQQQRFLFVASEPGDRFLLTLGGSLRPLEFAIVRSFREVIYGTVAQGHFRRQVLSSDTTWDGHKLSPYDWLIRFRDEVAPQIVVGVYRATRLGPPHLFYAHRDHADIAAHIAIADSVLQEHRGFPLLIDLADNVCRTVFGQETLAAPVETAYIEAGAPFKYVSERQTRFA